MRPPPLVFGLLLLVAVVSAQGNRGAIAGTVSDPRGEVVASAPIQATNIQTGDKRTAASSSTGQYTLADLPAGVYEISVALPAMAAFQQKNIAVRPGATSQLDIHLDYNTQLGTLGEDRLHFAADLKRHSPPAGPAPRTAEGKTDFSGVWWSPVTVDAGKPEWLPYAVTTAKQRAASNGKDNPQARCLPSAVLRLGPLYEIVQSQAFMIVISDDDSPGFHQVYLDGRGHPSDPNPAWYGHNIGRWEGDTLVVDRVAFHDSVWLDQAMHPHTSQLHVIQRYRRPDLGHLENEITVEDPGILAKPWTMKTVSDLAPNQEIYEFICPENNRDVEHLVGK